MSGMVNIVVADFDEVEAIGESTRPIEEWRGFAANGVGAEKLAMLQSMMTGQTFDEALSEYDPVYAASEDGPWVMRVREELIESLANQDEEILEEIGEELAATAEFEMDGWPVDAAQAFVAELASLAEISVAQEKAIFVWTNVEVRRVDS